MDYLSAGMTAGEAMVETNQGYSIIPFPTTIKGWAQNNSKLRFYNHKLWLLWDETDSITNAFSNLQVWIPEVSERQQMKDNVVKGGGWWYEVKCHYSFYELVKYIYTYMRRAVGVLLKILVQFWKQFCSYPKDFVVD